MHDAETAIGDIADINEIPFSGNVADFDGGLSCRMGGLGPFQQGSEQQGAGDARTDQIGNQPFTLISGDFSGQSGQLRLEQIGSDTLVQGDLNGDAMADFAILVQNALGLTALDFLL